MDFKNLKKFIKKEDKRLREYYGNYIDEEKRVLSRTVKLTEELGELCDEVLKNSGLQRKEKLKNHDGPNLPEEFADVVITTMLLAETMNVDIEKALEKKIEKIKVPRGKAPRYLSELAPLVLRVAEPRGIEPVLAPRLGNENEYIFISLALRRQ